MMREHRSETPHRFGGDGDAKLRQMALYERADELTPLLEARGIVACQKRAGKSAS